MLKIADSIFSGDPARDPICNLSPEIDLLNRT
jgi:hypothetical protein